MEYTAEAIIPPIIINSEIIKLWEMRNKTNPPSPIIIVPIIKHRIAHNLSSCLL